MIGKSEVKNENKIWMERQKDKKIKITIKIACRYLLFWIMKTTIDI